MDKMLGACGLACDECGAYKATKANDAEAIAKVAREWSKEYNADIKPEYVWCDGCMSDGEKKCGHCSECNVRACVVSRELENCAGCADYGCEVISEFLKMVPCCKERLEALRE